MLLPSVWRLAGTTLGLYLRKRTERQRQYLLETTAADEKLFLEEKREKQKKKNGDSNSDDDDWENVEAYGVGSAGNGGEGASDWDGIVGFFHPFWFVFLFVFFCVF